MGFGLQSGPTATPTDTSVVISWVNLEPGDGSVSLGTTPNADEAFGGDGTVDVLVHAVSVPAPGGPPLVANTQYYYFIKSVNSGGTQVAGSDVLTFTTLPAQPTVTGAQITEPHAEPRRVSPGATSTLSIVVRKGGQTVPGVSVNFVIDSGDAQLGPVGGAPTGSSTMSKSDSNGIASCLLTAGTTRGLVKTTASSSSATNSMQIPTPVEKG